MIWGIWIWMTDLVVLFGLLIIVKSNYLSPIAVPRLLGCVAPMASGQFV
jgi:hypothetical protein